MSPEQSVTERPQSPKVALTIDDCACVAAAVLAATSLVSPVKQFRLLEKSELPGRFLQNSCGRTADKSPNKDCLEDFNKMERSGWSGRVA